MLVLIKVPEIVDALEPVPPPVILPVILGVDQLYVVPEGTIPLVISKGVIVKDIPLQVAVAIGFTDATGLMVAVTVKLAPLQDPDVGVTV